MNVGSDRGRRRRRVQVRVPARWRWWWLAPPASSVRRVRRGRPRLRWPVCRAIPGGRRPRGKQSDAAISYRRSRPGHGQLRPLHAPTRRPDVRPRPRRRAHGAVDLVPAPESVHPSRLRGLRPHHRQGRGGEEPRMGASRSKRAAHLQGLTQLLAACMRRHDISMPDPPPNGGPAQPRPVSPASPTGSVGTRPSSAPRTSSRCRHLLPAGTRDDGTGP